MYIPDVNVLLYALDKKAVHHKTASMWLAGAFNGTDLVGLPWTVILAFIRLGTSPRIFSSPLTAARALDLVDEWFSLPSVVTVEPGPGHTKILRSLLAAAGTAGNLTTDAHIAALAIEHDAAVVSYDTDFSRFPGLQFKNLARAR